LYKNFQTTVDNHTVYNTYDCTSESGRGVSIGLLLEVHILVQVKCIKHIQYHIYTLYYVSML